MLSPLAALALLSTAAAAALPPAADGAVVAVTLYDEPFYGGETHYEVVWNYQFMQCFGVPAGFDNRMSSYSIAGGACEFFEHYGCVALMFRSDPGVRDIAALPPQFDNKMSSMRCYQGSR